MMCVFLKVDWNFEKVFVDWRKGAQIS